MADRGIGTSYETVRRWVLKLGPTFARNLRRLRPKPTDTWHLDQMMVSIQGRRRYLWRAVDTEGEILDILVHPKRDKQAALRLMRKLLKKQASAPDVHVTDKLASYGAARRELSLCGRMSRACERTIRSRTPIRRCDDASERCNGSSRLAQPSGSCPLTLPSTTRSAFNVTLSPAAPFGPSGPRRCKRGSTRPLRPDQTHHSGLCDSAPVPVTVP